MFKSKTSGFTLIEVLVVMIIIAVMMGGAILSVYKKDVSQEKQFSSKFTHEFKDLIDLSITTQRQFGLLFSQQGISLLKFQKTQWIFADNNLKKTKSHKIVKFPKNSKISFYINGNVVALNPSGTKEKYAKEIVLVPHVVIASSFEITPFELRVVDADKTHIFKSNIVGEIEYEAK